jgi:RHS repeat-associated protein
MRYSNLIGTQLVAETINTYDPLNRLAGINHKRSNGTSINNYTFGYDSDGRIVLITDVDGSTTYSYDLSDELTGADRPGTTGDEAYSYDANGNRTNNGYVTGVNNQLLSDGVYTYTYDDEGNLRTRTTIATGAVREYTWDYRNRLTSVIDRTDTIITRQTTYTYDALNQRIAKTVDLDGVGANPVTTTRFVYDRDNVVLEFTGTLANLSTRYLYGPGVDQILAQESNNTTTWLLTDQVGTVRDLVNNNGQLLNHFTYDSFGNVTGSTPNATVDTRYKFTGREFDAETGDYFYRARYYDPETARFLSEDTIGFDGGDVNLYRYVSNSPLIARDPFGSIKIEVVFNPLIQYPTMRARDWSNPSSGVEVDPTGPVISYDHAFIRVTDPSTPGGAPYYYRGGPKYGFLTQQKSILGFGSITTDYGIYRKGGTDWQDPGIQRAILVKEDPCLRWSDFHDKFMRSLEITRQANIAYNALGPNSNSVITQTLKDVKLPIPNLPSFINAPGWGMDLRNPSLKRWVEPAKPSSPPGPHDNLPPNLPSGTWAM